MDFKVTYKKLLDFNIYHHYFLDDGTDAFDSDPTLKTEQLEKYDLYDFLQVIPSQRTAKILNGQKIVHRLTNSGFSLFINAEETAPNSGIYEPMILLDQFETLDFLMYTSDALFENYSTVGANPSIPFYFSNRKPITHVGNFQFVDLETTTNVIEDFTISEDTYEKVSERLTCDERIGLFGVISLEMSGTDTVPIDGNARNILNTNGTLQDPAPVYKIQMLNRSTIWNYRNPVDGSLIHTSDPTLLPLVKNGIVGYSFDSEERPAADPSRIIYEKDGGGNIIKTFSEIYIN